MSSFPDAREALLRAMRAVFPDAKPTRGWTGIEAWGAPRPEAVVDASAPATYDPKVTVIGIADRKSGPTIYFLDPGDFFVLDTHKALLEGAGLKVGRGCIYHTRKGPLPADALEELFRRVKERDEKNAKRGEKKPAPRPAGPAKTVDAYLAGLPGPQRMALERLRRLILAAAPEATEKISYGVPTFAHAGKNLVHMAAFKDHCSFFPGSGGVTKIVESKLEGYATAKGTIRFAPNKPLPATLVKEIVRMRVAENEKLAAKRKAKAAPRKTRPEKRR